MIVDPSPWRPSGLQRSVCPCGARVYVDAGYAGPVACASCWRGRWGRPVMAWLSSGQREPAPRGVSLPSARGDRRLPVGSIATPYRVLTPARPAQGSELPAGARDLVVLANQHAHTVRATYALAEEREGGQLVHSLCVRVRAGAGAGYATWRNERFTMASWWPRGALGRRVPLVELRAILAGQTYAPKPRVAVVIGPCPRCTRLVRWRTATAQPWAHFRPDDGQRCTA